MKCKKPFVEVAIGDQKFERRDIEVGVSDGIFVEVKEGISKDYNLSLYRAELKLKKAHLNSAFYPLLLLLVAFKFTVRKL